MSTQFVRLLWGANGRASVRTRILTILFVYAVTTAAMLAALLLHLRSDAITAGETVLSAFAQLTEEQTARTFQSADQILQIAETTIETATAAGPAGDDAIPDALRALLEGRPYLMAISVTDGNGRVLYTSAPRTGTVDLSGRAYFKRHRDNPALGYEIGAPVRAATGEWLIPASRARRANRGQFAGVIVASINPLFFDRIWTIDKSVRGQATALWNDDGTLLMRSPFQERVIGAAFGNGAVFPLFRQSLTQGLFHAVSLVDGQDRIFAFRRLSAYPNFALTVSQTTASILAAWYRILWIVACGWIVSLLALAGVATWLAREWNARRDTVQRYRLLFESNPYPVVVVDQETQRFLAVNDTAVEQLGWSRREFLAMTTNDLMPAADLPELAAARASVTPGNTCTFQGLRNVLKDGTVIDIELSSRLIQFGGRPAFLTITKNVTEQRRAIESLRQSEEKYRQLVDALPVGVIETTVDGRVATANAAWRRMFGFGDSEDLDAIDVKTLYSHPRDHGAIVSRAEKEFTVSGEEAVFKRRDGSEFPVERHLRTISNAEGKIVGLRGIIIDISRRKLLEAQLQQSQKMEAVGQLTGGIAHDFNNILSVILANIEALDEEGNLDPRISERLGRIGRAVRRASELTRQLLAFSRKQPLRPQRTDINDLVTDVGKLLHRTLGDQVEIESALADDLWIVNVDRVQLESALVNLCINARDAMPNGGRLLIETGNATFDRDYIALNVDAVAGDYAMLAVTDTGVGMSPEVQARVFEPFFTTKGVGKGTGLGLSMVYGFIRQLRGHIRIDSEIGRGTTVRIYLPRSDGEVQDRAVARKASLPRGTERILVVEDDAQVRASVVQQLRSLGYLVSEVGNGASGVAAFAGAPEPFDLLLTDVMMPGALNGKALADEVARRWPAARIVFMSGYAESTLAQEGNLDARTFLLTKPFRKADLAQIVRQALDEGVPRST